MYLMLISRGGNMEARFLNEIRDKYNKQLEDVKKYDIIAKRVSELLENDTVKEYLELVKIMKEQECKRNQECSENDLINNSFYSTLYEIEETNNIYVYLGTYVSSRECDIVHGNSDIRLGREDPRADYSIYQNVESSDSVTIYINKRDEFEKTHTVIYPKTMLTESFFYAIQTEFFKVAVRESQEAACERILSEECHKDILDIIQNK